MFFYWPRLVDQYCLLKELFVLFVLMKILLFFFLILSN